LVLFVADYCPFAQRATIALLEKGTPYEVVEVNLYNKSLEDTKRLKEVNPSATVPSALHGDRKLFESLLLCEYVDETFQGPSLMPVSTYDRFLAKLAMKDISDNLVPSFYKLLQTVDEAAIKENSEKFLAEVAKVNAQLSKSGGPYYFGKEFSLVDIALMPFFERTVVVLTHFGKFAIPQTEEFKPLHKWMETCFQRESFKKSSADRTEVSMKVQPFRNQNRVEYLREMYKAYALGKTQKQRDILANSLGAESAIDITTVE